MLIPISERVRVRQRQNDHYQNIVSASSKTVETGRPNKETQTKIQRALNNRGFYTALLRALTCLILHNPLRAQLPQNTAPAVRATHGIAGTQADLLAATLRATKRGQYATSASLFVDDAAPSGASYPAFILHSFDARRAHGVW